MCPIECLGPRDIPRPRIGIVDPAADAALEFVVSGLNTAMNKFTGSATN